MDDEQRLEIIRLLKSKEEISPEWARILFPPEKREYELVYHGKEREEDIIANTLAVPLQKVRTFGKNGDGWHNKLIFGDNLQVMKSLLEMKRAGKLCNADGTPGVRLIYIDPPFATMQDFQGADEQKAYQDKIGGARFVEFLRKRLVLMRELLTHDGAIYVHLDWKKAHYIKVAMDEIFGESNFRNELIWHYPGREMHINTKFNAKHETILFYARSSTTSINMANVAVPYDKVERLKGLRRKVHRDASGKEWVWETRGQAAGQEPYKRYVDEIISQGRPLSDVWSDLQFLRGNHPERTGYPTQKPAALVERIVRASTGEGDLVMDAFGGSGTTCAVAEANKRRWIGIDCGKLAIYTIQKRMLNLQTEVGETLVPLKPRPFDLYNAGLYDFSKLKELSWDAWRFFALQLFQCRDEPHKIGGIQLDGYLKGSSVLVFNHQKQPGVRIDEDSIQSMHEALGSKVGSRMFIIAPALVFDFQQDYLTLDGVRYFALRIPYSIIHELHQREFAALKQPADEMAVNDTVDAVGFDFIRSPELGYVATVAKGKSGKPDEGVIRIKTFWSEAAVRDTAKKANRETLSMVMLDFDFDSESDVFDLDAVFYAEAIQGAGWEVRFPLESVGEKVMVVFVDIYGNEAREVIPAATFGFGKAKAGAKPAKKAAKPAKKPQKKSRK
ncbi:MAG: site-specific DNA-methyltransferase [Verrucomicrobia bacterium]|nr:site-specific DNA-methyltransferase [Verrucomicrobiota bacterium]